MYWQNKVRNQLKIKSARFCEEKTWNDYAAGFIGFSEKYGYDLIPEAMGLNVFETAKYHGIPIERNPQNILYKIAFMGVLK